MRIEARPPVRTRVGAPGALWIGASIALLLATGGCVNRGTYNEVRADRERLGRDNDRLVAENDRLRRQISAQGRQVSAMDASLAGERDEALREREAHEQVVAELRRELVAAQLEVEPVRDGARLRLPGDTLFRSGSSQLTAEGVGIVKRVASELGDVPHQIVVAGHTDGVSISKSLAKTHPTNWDLGAARAAAVVALLQAEGIAGEQLLAVSFGETRPAATNDTRAGRAQNRRIEIEIRPMPTPVVETPNVAAGPPAE